MENSSFKLYSFVLSVVLMVGLGQKAAASVRCAEVLADADKATILFQGELPDAKKLELTKLGEQAVADIQSLLPSDMSLPPNLRILFSNDVRDEYLAVKRAATINAEHTADETLRTTTHELGHGVAETSVDPYLDPALRTLRAKLDALMVQRDQINKEMQQQAKAGTLDYNAMNKKLGAVNVKIDKEIPFRSVFLTYQEFFADTLNVIVTGNPKANVFGDYSEAESFNRDFSVKPIQENIDKWKARGGTTGLLDSHFGFTPARWHVWSVIKDQMRTDDDKRGILGAIHRGTAKAMSNYLLTLQNGNRKKASDAILTVDMLALNEALIRSIDAELGK